MTLDLTQEVIELVDMLEHGNVITSIVVTCVGLTALLGAGLKVYWSLHNKVEKNSDRIQSFSESFTRSLHDMGNEFRRDIRDSCVDLRNDIDELRLQNAKQQHMIETSWQYVMDNANLAAQKRGLGELHSPLRASPTAREIFDKHNLTEELHKFYLMVGHTMSRIDLEMWIQRHFREKMLQTVCKEEGWTEGECIAVAVAIAKEAVREAVEE